MPVGKGAAKVFWNQRVGLPSPASRQLAPRCREPDSCAYDVYSPGQRYSSSTEQMILDGILITPWWVQLKTNQPQIWRELTKHTCIPTKLRTLIGKQNAKHPTDVCIFIRCYNRISKYLVKVNMLKLILLSFQWSDFCNNLIIYSEYIYLIIPRTREYQYIWSKG